MFKRDLVVALVFFLVFSLANVRCAEPPSDKFRKSMHKYVQTRTKFVAAVKRDDPHTDILRDLMAQAYYIKAYVEDHPRIRVDYKDGSLTGPEILGPMGEGFLAIGIGEKNEPAKKFGAEVYYTLIDLYPKSKEARRAKRTLRASGFDVD